MGFRAYIGLGSNMGDCLKNLTNAHSLLVEAGIKIIKSSSVYATKPVDYLAQADFLNQVVEVETDLDPQSLLAALGTIEDQCGRKREIDKGPRTLDLDILLYDNLEIKEPNLVVPHDQMLNRGFVLVPLAEIAPNLVLPTGISLTQALAGLSQEHLAGVVLTNLTLPVY